MGHSHNSRVLFSLATPPGPEAQAVQPKKNGDLHILLGNLFFFLISLTSLVRKQLFYFTFCNNATVSIKINLSSNLHLMRLIYNMLKFPLPSFLTFSICWSHIFKCISTSWGLLIYSAERENLDLSTGKQTKMEKPKGQASHLLKSPVTCSKGFTPSKIRKVGNVTVKHRSTLHPERSSITYLPLTSTLSPSVSHWSTITA